MQKLDLRHLLIDIMPEILRERKDTQLAIPKALARIHAMKFGGKKAKDFAELESVTARAIIIANRRARLKLVSLFERRETLNRVPQNSLFDAKTAKALLDSYRTARVVNT